MRITIPIDIVALGEENSYHLFVHSLVNGLPCDLLIDTGASQSVFDAAIVPEATAPTRTDIQSAGIGSESVENRVGFIERFKLGGLLIHHWEVVTIDLSHVNNMYSKFTSRRVAGLLGSDFLLRYKAVVNYRTRELTLRKRK